MNFESKLFEATLIKRYKRFLADITLPDGSSLTIHCPNTGSMKNCQQSGSRVWYSESSNPKRKYPHTWQLIQTEDKQLIGINTHIANRLVEEAISAENIHQLKGFEELKREVAYGERSRIDILLQNHSGDPSDRCYVEVKNVSLGVGDNNLGTFPDAVTLRGQKHLRELMEMKQQGYRAVLFFCVQHTGIDRVSPADDIDPEYGRLLRQAASSGVEVIAYGAKYNLEDNSVELDTELPVVL